mgnify:FL=1
MKKILKVLSFLCLSILWSTDCVVINEIHYNPDYDINQSDEDFEFLELYNQCNQSVDISHWSVYRHDSCWGCYYDHIYQFSNNVNLGPGNYIILAHNSETYDSSLDWGDEYLPNHGTSLILTSPEDCGGYNVEDYVTYDNSHPWPTEANGSGPSLELINPSLDNNHASAWQHSFVNGGTPGFSNSTYEDDYFDCSELDYWECIESSNCYWESHGWWSGSCEELNNEDDDESDENEDESSEEDDVVAFLQLGNFDGNKVELLVESNVDLAGFQFQLTGVTLQDANGGISEEYGFSVDYSSNTNIVIGFSLTGEHIPAGAYNLLDLYILPNSGSVCIQDAIFSDSYGEAIDLIYGDCLDFDEDIFGCVDSNACNYNQNATVDNGSCEYPDENFDCDGNCLVEVDCNGVCGGGAILDECGICGGEGIAEGACDCDGNIFDCAGTCGGNAVLDECGECNGGGAEFLCEDGSFACNEDSCNNFNGCDLPSNSLYIIDNDILYNSDIAIAGFQFDVDGSIVASVSGGDAELAGFTVSSGGTTVLGFSFSGATIPAGCGILTSLVTNESDASGLSSIIISDSNGQSVNFTYFNGDEDCPSGNYDCNNLCDGDAIEDECGICDGDNECFGCTDSDALNYDLEASIDDGSCEYFDYSNTIHINEIHYNPSLDLQGADANYEFIELYNTLDVDISLSNWFLETSNISFTFPPNTTISSQEYLLLSRETGVYENSLIWGSERLENSTDFVSLYDSQNQLVDLVEFSDSEPWPTSADAGGSSLELLSVDLDNNNSASWQSSFNIGGTPGLMNYIPVFGCIDSSACNFDSNATEDDQSCVFAELNFDCDGNCLVEVDCNGVCGGTSELDDCGVCDGDGLNCVEGCTDSLATNYNLNATIDDGTCFYAGNNYPNWDTDFDSVLDNFADYEYSSSITGLVFNENVSVLGENDMLAAFAGDELRGVAQAISVPTALGHELSFFILIYSNLDQGDNLNFKYYSFNEDQIYDLNEQLMFTSDDFLGDVDNPFIFTYGDYDYYYNMSLENTGSSTLFIFNDTVNLEYGDEIGIFDLNGIQNSDYECEESVFGETLVGSGMWQGSQLEVVAIESVDLCDFGGFQLAGYQNDNEIIIKVWSASEQVEYYAVADYFIGQNIFGEPLYVIDSLNLVPESEFFVEISPLSLNLVSMNVATANHSVEDMFGHDILLIFDDNSNFYIPDYEINQIENYNFAEGYMMFADHSIEMNMSGQAISHNHPIVLDPYKANMIPYFHESCLPVEYAFSSLSNQILLVKDDQGLYYIPNQNINTLESLCPGNAYIVFLNSEISIEFSYPEMISNRQISNLEPVNTNLSKLADHSIYKTGISTPIIINEFIGDYIAGDDLVVFANNIPVGVSEISGEFPIVISSWAQFETSNYELPGYEIGDEISVKLYRDNEYIDVESSLSSDFFGTENIITGTIENLQDVNIVNNFRIKDIYPNPFNPLTNISLEINQGGNYSFMVYDMLGQVVYESELEYSNPGSYDIQFNGQNLSSGTYIVVIANSFDKAAKKITLLK